ncbi:MAG TPA: DUF6259 domain-containing protein [Verrucomicrobiae bacterium]|nr:DUF6259 domain-containing protein [Verrucomicrobiae bacterium]
MSMRHTLMKYRWPFALLALVPYLLATAAEPVPEIVAQSSHFRASIAQGGIADLRDAKGIIFARDGGTNTVAKMHWIIGECAMLADRSRHSISAGQRTQVSYGPPAGTDGGAIDQTCAIDASTGDLIIEQNARSPKSGLWGVSWSIGDIPEDFAIIVPGRSGIRLDAKAPGEKHTFDYPQGWEAQLVIVEGAGRGFYVFADDPDGRYKRLTVTQTRGGWRLQLATLNDAPFDNLTECASVRWRLNTYEGDWRVPARRYHDWMTQNFKPETTAGRQPAWAKDIRACVIVGMSVPLIEELAKRLDPKQTLLYIPDWRSAGYDRNYPDYTAPREDFGPFLARAHELGFRVMPHVNYFGVDPLNAEYETFRPFHVRSPWGKHEPEWWDWDRAQPPIKFAYINPAAPAWRRRFVGAMAELCRRLPIDALHLDQTLCIYNDNNGRIDGMNMIAGNIALHRELRTALPDVALSGEGLNEVTCRYESFAQRHVFGLDHSERTWNEAWLARAHPISSYLFVPHTTIYGYLGMAPPDVDQLYGAWNQAYAHFGVIPTLRTDPGRLKSPTGFLTQFFDEAKLWQERRLSPDPDGPWLPDVAFPFRAADGGHAARMIDGRLLDGTRVVSQTLFGLNRAQTAFSIPGWPVYDTRWIMGLDPARRYPTFAVPRDNSTPHFVEFPEGLVAESAVIGPDFAVIRTRAVRGLLLDACADLRSAECGIRWCGARADGNARALSDDSGARFQTSGNRISAHPPYKNVPPGGETFARFHLALPRDGRPRFTSSEALGKGASEPGHSDGVLFRVTASANGKALVAEHLQTSEEPAPLDLDLSPIAGHEIDLDLVVHPGPRNDPRFDWAEWLAPRVETEAHRRGSLAITPGDRWTSAIDAAGTAHVEQKVDTLHIQADLPGSVFLLKDAPAPATLPLDVIGRRRFVITGGTRADSFAADVPVGARSCGGVSKKSLFAHPPPNGTTALHFPILLPQGPAQFHTFVGLADGSKSKGATFIVEINGKPAARESMLPGGWREISSNLGPWAGKPIILSLITDPDGSYEFDWTVWGEPKILPAH